MTERASLRDARLTDEHLRILIAIDEGRMKCNQHGRYVIEEEERPDRKSREQLRSRGLAVPWYTFGQGHEWRLTAKGRKVLRAALSARVATSNAEVARLQAEGLPFAEAYLKATSER